MRVGRSRSNRPDKKAKRQKAKQRRRLSFWRRVLVAAVTVVVLTLMWSFIGPALMLKAAVAKETTGNTDQSRTVKSIQLRQIASSIFQLRQSDLSPSAQAVITQQHEAKPASTITGDRCCYRNDVQYAQCVTALRSRGAGAANSYITTCAAKECSGDLQCWGKVQGHNAEVVESVRNPVFQAAATRPDSPDGGGSSGSVACADASDAQLTATTGRPDYCRAAVQAAGMCSDVAVLSLCPRSCDACPILRPAERGAHSGAGESSAAAASLEAASSRQAQWRDNAALQATATRNAAELQLEVLYIQLAFAFALRTSYRVHSAVCTVGAGRRTGREGGRAARAGGGPGGGGGREQERWRRCER
jgi:hypothetical protein